MSAMAAPASRFRSAARASAISTVVQSSIAMSWRVVTPFSAAIGGKVHV
jgi:hypothetical protein